MTLSEKMPQFFYKCGWKCKVECQSVHSNALCQNINYIISPVNDVFEEVIAWDKYTRWMLWVHVSRLYVVHYMIVSLKIIFNSVIKKYTSNNILNYHFLHFFNL